jgi:ADP-heptose:LPS heptosyltransferase
MIKNILVVRNDRFGEFLLNIPAMRELKEKYPQARFSVAVDSAVCELAGVVECIDQVLVWNEIKGNLRKYKFDLCVVLNPTKEAHWAGFWAGIPVRVGYNRKWGFLLTHKIKDTKHLGNRHEVDCNLELVGLVGARTFDKTLKIKINDNLFNEFIGQKIVAIHPFTSDPVKQWPVEWFGELAQRIRHELGIKVVMVGKDKEIACLPAGRLRHFAPHNDGKDDGIVNLVNKTSLVELAALLKRCSLLISGDSGPMHLAAAVGTPVVALFRNDLPGKTARRWGPWGKGHIVIEKGDLLNISVDEVLGVVKKQNEKE